MKQANETEPGKRLRHVSIPRTAVVQLRIDIPCLVQLRAAYPETPRETPLKNQRDSTAKFFLDTIYKMAWHAVDNFGSEDSDPRLAPLLDLIEALDEMEPIS